MNGSEKPELKTNAESEELTAQVQRLQQMRGSAAGATVPQQAMNLMDARPGKPPVFRGEDTKWQGWYFKFRAYMLCSGDRHPELVTAVEDPAQ